MRVSDILEQKQLDELDLKKSLKQMALGGALVGAVASGLPGKIDHLLHGRSHEDRSLDLGIDHSGLFRSRDRDDTEEKLNKKEQDKNLKSHHDSAIVLLAKTIWGEARAEGVRGMRAVAHVIKNRAESERNEKSGYRLYGKGIIGVIKNDKAFSAWNKDDVNRKLLDQLENDGSNLSGPDREAYLKAKAIAASVLSGKDRDPTNGADHYHTKGIRPSWSKKRKGHIKPTITAKIGNHVFYKDINTPPKKVKANQKKNPKKVRSSDNSVSKSGEGNG